MKLLYLLATLLLAAAQVVRTEDVQDDEDLTWVVAKKDKQLVRARQCPSKAACEYKGKRVEGHRDQHLIYGTDQKEAHCVSCRVKYKKEWFYKDCHSLWYWPDSRVQVEYFPSDTGGPKTEVDLFELPICKPTVSYDNKKEKRIKTGVCTKLPTTKTDGKTVMSAETILLNRPAPYSDAAVCFLYKDTKCKSSKKLKLKVENPGLAIVPEDIKKEARGMICW